MKKTAYLTPENIDAWTARVLGRLAASRGRTRLPPVLDASAALLMLDPQRIFVDEASPAFLPSWKGVEPNCTALVEHAAATGRVTIVTRHVHPPRDDGGTLLHFFGRLIRETDELSGLVPGMQGRPGVEVVTKARHSAFSVDGLDRDLRRRGIGGLLPVVVADATAADDEGPHLAVLEALSGGIACIMSTREVIQRWH
jgi:isochorismate hydrolase